MSKFYIDPHPFAHDNPNMKWEMIIDIIESKSDFIEVVEELTENSDIKERKLINELLNDDVEYFKCQKPIERSVSLSPFFVREVHNSVCFRYKKNDEIIKELKTNWFETLQKELVIPSFTAYNNTIPILCFGFFGTIALLGKGELHTLNSMGFEFVEYEISLNHALYKTIDESAPNSLF